MVDDLYEVSGNHKKLSFSCGVGCRGNGLWRSSLSNVLYASNAYIIRLQHEILPYNTIPIGKGDVCGMAQIDLFFVISG